MATFNYHCDSLDLLPDNLASLWKRLKNWPIANRNLVLSSRTPFVNGIRSKGPLISFARTVMMMRPLSIDELGEPYLNWYGGGKRNFLEQQLVVFMGENQGVCNWAFRLDGNPDPEVVVEVDTAPNDEWLPCADRFSTFVYCQIWDHRRGCASAIVAAQELEFPELDLQFLKSNFVQHPSTYGWPGRSNYRFEDQDGAILIWDSEEQGADWFASARTPASLHAVLSRIWHCGNLAETMYSVTPEAANILRVLRATKTMPRGGRIT